MLSFGKKKCSGLWKGFGTRREIQPWLPFVWYSVSLKTAGQFEQPLGESRVTGILEYGSMVRGPAGLVGTEDVSGSSARFSVVVEPSKYEQSPAHGSTASRWHESDGHLRKLLSPQLGRSGSPARPPWLLPPVLTAATWGATVTLEWTQHTSIWFSTFSGRTWHQECVQVLSGRRWSGSEEAGRFDPRLFANAEPRLISYRWITMSLALATRVDRKVVTHIRKSVHCGQRGAPGGVPTAG